MGCLLGPHEGTGQGLRTIGWGVDGDTSILTDVGTANVEQVLVHHRHAILGRKQARTGKAGSLLFPRSVPEIGRSGPRTIKSSVSVLACPLWGLRQPASFIPVDPMALAGPQHLPNSALKFLYPAQRHPTDALPERTGPQELWESDERLASTSSSQHSRAPSHPLVRGSGIRQPSSEMVVIPRPPLHLHFPAPTLIRLRHSPFPASSHSSCPLPFLFQSGPSLHQPGKASPGQQAATACSGSTSPLYHPLTEASS